MSTFLRICECLQVSLGAVILARTPEASAPLLILVIGVAIALDAT